MIRQSVNQGMEMMVGCEDDEEDEEGDEGEEEGSAIDQVNRSTKMRKRNTIHCIASAHSSVVSASSHPKTPLGSRTSDKTLLTKSPTSLSLASLLFASLSSANSVHQIAHACRR